MANIYGVLHVGQQALLAQQEALNVTAQNIANANTPGYSRQRVVMETTTVVASDTGNMGTGVTIGDIERVYNSYLNHQIREESETLGRWQTEKNGLERVEVVFNEASQYGLSQSLGEFWNAWQDLVSNPSGYTERQMLIGSAEDLAHRFQGAYSDLSDIQAEMDNYVSQGVSEINIKAAGIAELNQKIVQIEAGSGIANSFRDERDVLLKELSSLIDISAVEQDNSSLTLTLGDGGVLVEGAFSSNLTTLTNGSGYQDVAWESAPSVGINSSISGGQLKGLFEARDVAVPGYKEQLEDLVDTIRDGVNAIHANGFGLDGSTGNAFFTGAVEDNDFGIASTVSGDVNKIAAAGTASGVPGDNSNAISIAELQNSLTMSSNTATYDDYYNAIVSGIGFDVQQATSSYTQQDAMISYLENYRESISGVSLDEEMINMLQFEAAYESAAKLISKIDEMLQTLLNIV